MIAFDLQCSNGHTFEGWFEDSQAYEEQKEKSLIACPVCNDTSVFKIPSAFAIKSSRTAREVSDQQAELTDINNKIADFVDKNFEDVGCDFAKEALKIHYGVSKPRNIKGNSTEEEEKTLEEEGIKFFKVPVPPPADADV
ncbi:DUF1178 family protein [Desulfonema magnum]|uniref:DUF1178 n=1 Tax=Desulfonema magnum TaxID=45655 RepID=A0A975BEL1_9BACT|nr:DUF1178 family protein [Desulfonema magnum]QTA84097.1 DUF1178 [Desulfonema magnum]